MGSHSHIEDIKPPELFLKKLSYRGMFFIFTVLMVIFVILPAIHSLKRYYPWTDEMFTLSLLSDPYPVFMKRLLGDVHPPFYYMLLRLFFSHSCSFLHLRLFSMILGILSLYGIYFLYLRVGNKDIGIMAGLLFMLSPLFQYYLIEARNYTLLLLTIILAEHVSLNYMESGRRLWLGMFLFLSLLMIYTHFYGAFILAGYAALSIIEWWKGRERKRNLLIILACLVAIACALPWYLMNIRHQIAWGPETPPAPVDLLAALFIVPLDARRMIYPTPVSPFAPLIGIIWVGLIIAGWAKIRKTMILRYATLIIGATMAVFVASYIFRPLLVSIKWGMLINPFIFLSLGFLLASCGKKNVYILIMILLFGMEIFSDYTMMMKRPVNKMEFKSIFHEIKNHTQKGDMIIIHPYFSDTEYLIGVKSHPPEYLASYNLRPEQTVWVFCHNGLKMENNLWGMFFDSKTGQLFQKCNLVIQGNCNSRLWRLQEPDISAWKKWREAYNISHNPWQASEQIK